MKRLIVFLAMGGLLFTLANAQEANTASDTPKKDWTIKGVTGLNASQTSLTNWAAGGENTVAGNLYLNIDANYLKDKWSWDNGLRTDFGLTYTTANKWNKSVDKIELFTKAGYEIGKHWYGSALFTFLSQYAKGYEKPSDHLTGVKHISNFFAPAYLTLGIGADYKPNEKFSLYLSPTTGKLTVVADDYLSSLGAFGVKAGEKTMFELGALVVGSANINLMENVNLITKASFFSAYTHDFGNIDINWEVMLAMKINKFLTATIATNLIYDDDVKINDGPKIQFKEVVGVGVAYTF